MKATKKIVGAACALVAAVALSAGSTFAWFTSNGEVTATGMQIDVNTSNSYLVIGAELTDITPANGTGFEYKKTISLAPTEGSSAKKIYASAYNPVAADTDTDTTGKSTLAASGEGSIVDASSWYTAEGTSPTDGTLKGDKTYLNAVGKTFGDYVVVDDIFVSVAVGSEALEHVYLTVTPATGSAWSTTNNTATNNSALSVVVLYQKVSIGGNLSTWTKAELNAANNHAFNDDGYLDLAGVSATEYIQVKLMVYLDGNNTDVKSANAKNLAGITLDFKFTDEVPTV